MNNQPRRFRKGDTSDDHPGLIFVQRKNGHEYWTTPKQYLRNDEYQRQYCRKYYKRYPERCKKSRTKWRAKPGSLETAKRAYDKWVNSDKGKIVRRKVTARYRGTINGTMINRVRSRIWQALKRGFTKSASTLELVGCSMLDFRNHIEKQFKDGMSWDNVGLWEIDHITPLSAFDMNDPAQQRLAFRYTNCRPLWKNLNRQKSDKIEGELFRGRHFKQNIIPFKAA